MTQIRKAFASKGDDVTLSRFVKIKGGPVPPVRPKSLRLPGLGNPSIEAGRSIFYRKGITAPGDRVLVSGHSNVKIGRDVRKGYLRGYWIFTLSLEERATCPRTCHHWQTCYGNGMPYAKRVDHRDPLALELAIRRNVALELGRRGRRGILVRLHALGDFFDVAYVRFWSQLLDEYPNLAVYGYTAWPLASPIGRAILSAKMRHGERFRLRWSNGPHDRDCATPIRSVDAAVNAIVCPEQTGRTAACATCGLCWGTTRNIAFLEH